MVGGNCFSRGCDKIRFMEYYVCSAHFVAYADSRYTESMLVKIDPAPPEDLAPTTYAAGSGAA